MANDSNRADELYTGPDDDSRTDMNEDRMRGGVGDEVRGIADEDDEEFDEDEEMDEEEEDEGAI